MLKVTPPRFHSLSWKPVLVDNVRSSKFYKLKYARGWLCQTNHVPMSLFSPTHFSNWSFKKQPQQTKAEQTTHYYSTTAFTWKQTLVIYLNLSCECYTENHRQPKYEEKLQRERLGSKNIHCKSSVGLQKTHISDMTHCTWICYGKDKTITVPLQPWQCPGKSMCTNQGCISLRCLRNQEHVSSITIYSPQMFFPSSFS